MPGALQPILLRLNNTGFFKNSVTSLVCLAAQKGEGGGGGGGGGMGHRLFYPQINAVRKSDHLEIPDLLKMKIERTERFLTPIYSNLSYLALLPNGNQC